MDLLPEALCRPARLMEKRPELENTPSSAGKASLDTPATLQGSEKPRGRPAWLMLCAGVCVECTAVFMHVMNVCVVAERGCEKLTARQTPLSVFGPGPPGNSKNMHTFF